MNLPLSLYLILINPVHVNLPKEATGSSAEISQIKTSTIRFSPSPSILASRSLATHSSDTILSVFPTLSHNGEIAHHIPNCQTTSTTLTNPNHDSTIVIATKIHSLTISPTPLNRRDALLRPPSQTPSPTPLRPRDIPPITPTPSPLPNFSPCKTETVNILACENSIAASFGITYGLPNPTSQLSQAAATVIGVESAVSTTVPGVMSMISSASVTGNGAIFSVIEPTTTVVESFLGSEVMKGQPTWAVGLGGQRESCAGRGRGMGGWGWVAGTTFLVLGV